MERLIASEFEIRAPRGVVANRGDVEAATVCPMNRSYLGEVALSFE